MGAGAFVSAWPDYARGDARRARFVAHNIFLAELGEPEPVLPPYDPATRQRFDWQDDVEAAIADLERQKAERDRQPM